MLAPQTAEEFVQTAVAAICRGGDYGAALDQLPVPVYVTDAEGRVTYWNKACVDFSGREPELGRDRWCVTWRIHTPDGDYLPHDKCPMAEAIRARKEVRGKVAIAMRPDGTRRAFVPYPTPLFDESGNLTGAVNLLLDVSKEQASALAEQAERCRRIARATHDSEASSMLSKMAAGYEENAEALKHH